jgi:small subunit ribosomal protein S14
VAKKSKIEREKRIVKLAARYQAKRSELLAIIKDPEKSMDEKLEAQAKLRKIPRNASPVRQQNRCGLTGRPRGYLRKFDLCRIKFRDLALEGKIPGVTKSSW